MTRLARRSGISTDNTVTTRTSAIAAPNASASCDPTSVRDLAIRRPDTNAHGLGEHPQVVYNVRFDGRELWGDSAEPRQTVSIDLWESYLEPASR